MNISMAKRSRNTHHVKLLITQRLESLDLSHFRYDKKEVDCVALLLKTAAKRHSVRNYLNNLLISLSLIKLLYNIYVFAELERVEAFWVQNLLA